MSVCRPPSVQQKIAAGQLWHEGGCHSPTRSVMPSTHAPTPSIGKIYSQSPACETHGSTTLGRTAATVLLILGIRG